MIYQLKISLKRSKPPIWRRIQVDSGTTFRQLHDIIQIIMEWENRHLHLFECKDVPEEKRSQAVKNWYPKETFGSILDNALVQSPQRERAVIGPKESADGVADMFFHETTETIDEWLFEVGHKCTYVYDFSDDWQHLIELEKIVEADTNTAYPICIKARRPAPDEDSGGIFQTANSTRRMSDHHLQAEINRALRQLNGGKRNSVNPTAFNQVKRESGPWQILYDYVLEYKDLKCWQWMSDNQIFAIQTDSDSPIMYCSVLGQAGESFGLAVFIGDDGLRILQNTLHGELDTSSQEFFNQRSIMLTFEDRDMLSEKDYERVKAAGLRFRGPKQWPMMRSYRPGFHPWYIDKSEAKQLTICLQQTIEVARRMQDEPMLLHSTGNQTVFARIREKNDQWIDGSVRFQPHTQHVQQPRLAVSEINVHQLKKDFPRRASVLEFDMLYSPQPIQESEEQRPYYPYLGIWMEQNTGMVLDYAITGHDDVISCMQRKCLSVFETLRYIPQKIQVSRQQAYDMLWPIANILRIDLELVNELPQTDNAIEGMFQALQ